ncbi:MAG: TonB-dependent receptor [Chitinophaga sp.]|uniref:TonB-dependent receptor n=1 Tax=Chitinophaga sp. TaxID=1869181 RepID=UPI0025C6CC6B|nr:TonB-dependent receptor [Chitinophaga sp.]MBV8251833.1 TonB-dependent receptor [Chitinophaga sp.]
MKYILFIPFLLCILLLQTAAYAQQKDTIPLGTLHGNVLDSAYDYVLPSATIAVYKATDSSLLSFQLTDGFGDFRIAKVPVDIPLKVVVSFMGYKSAIIYTKIPLETKDRDLKKINMERGVHTLKDVVITRPPVELNGDTLEFNADAFKLDSNAVIEDLFKRLPGITIWGDGTITVNGRTVSKVLIDGKEFFGGSVNMALQNIPKQAVDKIQVYQREKDPTSPIKDSVTHVNIKLKKEWKMGKFGKIAAGGGTDGRYESDVMFSLFNKRTQFAVAGATNNVNKSAANISSLIDNGSYKTFSGLSSYRPNFSAAGIQQTKSGGFIFRRDFNEGANDYNNKNALEGNFKYDDLNTHTNSTKNQITLLEQGQQTSNSASSSINWTKRMDANTKYDRRTENFELTIAPSANFSNSRNQSSNQTNTSSSSAGDVSQNNNTSYGTNDGKQAALNIHFTQNPSYRGNIKGRFTTTHDYRFQTTSNDIVNNSITNFHSFLDDKQDTYYNRRYDTHKNGMSHTLDSRFGDLSKGIKNGKLLPFSINASNNLSISKDKGNTAVQDYDTTQKTYTANSYLTNKSDLLQVKEIPSLEFNKSIIKNFVNRYYRSLNFNFVLKEEFFFMHNNSEKSFQDITRRYSNFIPQASIFYNNYLYDRRSTEMKLGFSQRINYATINELAPLIDSSNVLYQQYGNAGLKESRAQELMFNYNMDKLNAGNPLDYFVYAKISRTNNAIGDSTIYTDDGKTRRYLVNVNNVRSAIFHAGTRRGFKFGKTLYTIEPSIDISLSSTPAFVNSVNSELKSQTYKGNLTLGYELQNKLSVQLSEGITTNYSQQDYRNTSSEVLNNSLRLLATWYINKAFTLYTDVDRNTNTSSGTEGVRFTNWSMSANYRFLKGKNAEVRLAAYDILRQNKGITNTTQQNFITTCTSNVMQQFFMCTIAYYPRMFGKHAMGK